MTAALILTGYALMLAFIAYAWATEARRDREARAAFWAAQDAADAAVLDTVQRWRRDQDANRIARHVRGAFLAQMQAEADEDAFDRAREQIRALPETEETR